VSEHISRKELKQDKIKETLEHGAEAVYSHSQLASVIVGVLILIGCVYGGWALYHDRQTGKATVELSAAMKVYTARIAGAPEQGADPNETVYPDEAARAQAAVAKFVAVADKYPGTNPGKVARYYAALCYENMEQLNSAQEQLQKMNPGTDSELSAMAEYQLSVIDARTGKSEEAVKLLRALAAKPTVLVPHPVVLLDLAGLLRQSNPQEAMSLYQQVKKDYPEQAIIEEAERGLSSMPAGAAPPAAAPPKS
jgi:predicted negative regulator of RcsB-dependent stress response